MSLLAELKRRNVVRAVVAYVAVAWLVIQVAEATFPAFGLSQRALRLLILALAIGFVAATSGPDGEIRRDDQRLPRRSAGATRSAD